MRKSWWFVDLLALRFRIFVTFLFLGGSPCDGFEGMTKSPHKTIAKQKPKHLTYFQEWQYRVHPQRPAILKRSQQWKVPPPRMRNDWQKYTAKYLILSSYGMNPFQHSCLLLVRWSSFVDFLKSSTGKKGWLSYPHRQYVLKCQRVINRLPLVLPQSAPNQSAVSGHHWEHLKTNYEMHAKPSQELHKKIADRLPYHCVQSWAGARQKMKWRRRPFLWTPRATMSLNWRWDWWRVAHWTKAAGASSSSKLFDRWQAVGSRFSFFFLFIFTVDPGFDSCPMSDSAISSSVPASSVTAPSSEGSSTSTIRWTLGESLVNGAGEPPRDPSFRVSFLAFNSNWSSVLASTLARDSPWSPSLLDKSAILKVTLLGVVFALRSSFPFGSGLFGKLFLALGGIFSGLISRAVDPSEAVSSKLGSSRRALTWTPPRAPSTLPSLEEAGEVEILSLDWECFINVFNLGSSGLSGLIVFRAKPFLMLLLWPPTPSSLCFSSVRDSSWLEALSAWDLMVVKETFHLQLH